MVAVLETTFKMNKKGLPLDPELLSPLLGYYIQVWMPQMNNNTENLEAIHRRVSRMVKQFEAIDRNFSRNWGCSQRRETLCVFLGVWGEDA